MKVSDKGLAEIAGHEGIVASPYYDSVGVLTWGIGHTKAAGGIDPATLPMGKEAPLEAILATFREDIEDVELRVSQAVNVPLSQTQFDALVSFDFNTGGIYKAQLTKRLNAGDLAGAASGFDGWHKPQEIIPRRDKERKLFATGVYSNGGKALVIPADAKGKPLYRQGRTVDVLAILTAGAQTGGKPTPVSDTPFHLPPDVEPPQPQETPSGFWAVLVAILRSIFGRRSAA